MFNDVHLARVSKIQRSGDVAKGNTTETKCNARRSISRNIKEVHLANNAAEIAFVGGHVPRSGDIVIWNEIESPDHTQRENNESDNNISSCSTLDIGKVENLSLQQLEVQVRDLVQRLQSSEQQRVDLQRKLEECNGEKDLCLRRLEVVSAAHECRITEMHCVIAELSKKLRAKQETVIPEENEPEESELSFQEDVSVYNSELNLTNPDAECQTDLVESGAEQSICEGHSASDNVHCDIDITEQQRINDVVCKGQVEALQEEVLHLKAQIALLQSEIANNELIPKEQKQITEKGNQKTSSDEKTSENDPEDFVTPQKQYELLSTPHVPPPVAKIAERVKLKCGTKSIHSKEDSKTLSDILNAEHEKEDMVESLVIDSKTYDKSMTNSYAEVSDMDTELQRLQRKIEQLKVRNTILSLTLDECKEHCDHLYLLCGKYESNAIALQTAVNCSDRAIEAYDVMLALLESKLALMTEKSVGAEESRRAVEKVARHLLDRLESEKNTCENSLGPWQSTFSIPDKVWTPWTTDDDNRLRYHVSKLKGRRSTVQNTIVNLESPFSDLYEKSRKALECGKGMVQQVHNAQFDLEMAVIMQELLNLREENINLKSKVESGEVEKRLATERNSSLEETLQQLQLQLQMQLQISTDASSALFHREQIAENRVSYSESEHVALTEQQLVEALTRESELKSRIQTLISSVTASQLSADERHIQLQNNIQELQKSNLNLTQLLEQNKRRYQARVRRLEQKIVEMSFGMDHKTNGEKFYVNESCITRDNFSKSITDCDRVSQQPQCLKSKNSEVLTYESQLQIQEIVPETTL
ncbi:colorectal mutant cancer protein isoform X2 [Rhagoletis pomonella]|uniref:colorectal mutant cancer protein isoform X2 n=1 Tax=Rhagoletis pomonella TaxID=28610 RepID=UPI00177DAC76|nr:colorectal mutant cancer protein isoform X2 [Rhagoletis pomonella]